MCWSVQTTQTKQLQPVKGACSSAVSVGGAVRCGWAGLWACGVSVGGAVGCVEVGMWVGVEIPVLHMGWYDRVSIAINLVCEI